LSKLSISYTCTSAFKLSNLKTNLYSKLQPCKNFVDPYFVNPVKIHVVVDNFFFNLFIINFYLKKINSLNVTFVNSWLFFSKNRKSKFVITRGPNRHKLSKDILTISRHQFYLKFNFIIKQRYFFKNFLIFFKKVNSKKFLIDTAMVKCSNLTMQISFIENSLFKIY
jgi:hypothetical protein